MIDTQEKCTGCGHIVYVSPEDRGTWKPCVHCGRMMRVPGAEGTSAPRPATSQQSRYSREKLTFLGWLTEAPWFRPVVIILLVLATGGFVYYCAARVMRAGKPAHYMTRSEFITALDDLTVNSPYRELDVIRREDFLASFGKPDSKKLHRPQKYDTWYRFHYETKDAPIVVNLVESPALPDGKPREGWVKVWLPDSQADRRAEQELRDPAGYQKAREARAYYERNRAAILSAISRGDSFADAEQYKQAIQAYGEALAIVRRGPSLQGQLGTVLRSAEDKLNAARSRQRYAAEREASGIALAARQSFDRGELDSAEMQYRNLIQYVVKHDLQSASSKEAARTAEARLREIPRLRREEKRRSELARQEEQREAEAERQAEEQRQAAVRRLRAWDGVYAAVVKTDDEIASPSADHLAQMIRLRKSLSSARASLNRASPTEKYAGMWVCLDKVTDSVRMYCERLSRLARDSSDSTSMPVAKVAAFRKIYQKAAQDDLTVFVCEYVAARTALGESVAIGSERLRAAVEAERARRSQCAECRGKGKIPCSGCRDRNISTGKRVCLNCGGKRYVSCTTCGGDFARTCSTCRGKGKVYSHTVTDRLGFSRKDVYKRCISCDGKGTTWRRLPGYRRDPGKCPTCTRQPGKMGCPTCRASGRYGTCPTCQGKRQITCRECMGTGKKGIEALPSPKKLTGPG